MELRNLAIFLGLVLAVTQCSGKPKCKKYGCRERAPEASNEPPPVQAQITTISKTYEVKAGSNVRLECNVNPDDGTVAQWYKGSDLYFVNTLKTFYDPSRDLSRYSIVHNSKDLVIMAVKPSDAGFFKCEVVQNSPVSVEHTVVVLESPEIIQARHSMHRRETDYDFANDEGDKDDDEPQNDEYDGERAPEASNQPPPVQAQITTISKTYEVKAGSNVRLECNVDPDDGTVAQWYKGSDLYFMNTMKTFYDRDLSRYSIVRNSKDLVIMAVEPSDAGVFKCEVVQNSPVSVEHTVVVLESPEIIRFTATNNGKVEEGANLLLTCEAIGKPPPSIVWSRDAGDGNSRLNGNDGEFTQNSVYMKGVTRELSGKYYCYAFNSVGNKQAELDVSVLGKPHVHVHKTVINSAIKVEALLQCSIRFDANPHIRWYKDGKLIEDSSTEYIVSTHGTHSNLTVTPDEETDFGTYTCEAENDIGKHNRSIELVQRPVIESLTAKGGRLAWTVHSHQLLQDLQAQVRGAGGDSEWKQFDVPLPSSRSHLYELTFDLNEKLDAGKYEAFVKARNEHSWSDNVEPVVFDIDVQPSMSIQHAGVFLGSNSHSIRPSSVVLSTILMYLLVRTL